MFLKIMDGADMPDAAPDKSYRLIECREVWFMRGLEGGNGWAQVDGLMVALTGNAYIMNSAGKTIDSYWSANRSAPAEPLRNTNPA